MKALSFLLKRTIINYFKRLRQKPSKLVGPIFVILWFVLMFLPGSKGKNISGEMDIEIFVAIFTAVAAGMFLYSLYSGTKKLDSKFGMCDVNLIFVSPIKPQTVLLYGVIKKIAVELLASIYILYQIPNLLRKYNVPVLNQIMLIVAYVLFQLVFCNILKLFIFALNTRNAKLGETIRLFIKGLLIFAAAYCVMIFVKGSYKVEFKQILAVVTNSSWFGKIPVIGWMRDLSVQAIKGMNLSTVLYLLLFLLVSALMLYITYNLKLDYYEDMLTGAEQLNAVQSGNMSKEGAVSGNGSALNKPIRKRALKLDQVYGAKVLFFKHLNEYIKRSFVFFINTYSVILLAASIILGIFAKSVDIKIVFLSACGLLFFSAGMGGKIYTEIYHYFIFLLPDTPQHKLFYGTASALVKAVSDSLLLFIPFGILSHASVLEVAASIICYVLLAGMLSYSGLFAFRIAQFLGFDGLIAQGLLFMLFQLLLAVPLVIIAAVVTLGFKTIGGYSIYLSFMLYSLVMAFLFSFGCVGIFKDTEF